ncbi:hypothetical protein G5V59_20395 [Nocardioides sp. W3-2-3]|uniref:dimethylarginine dimethylaminohydrolase family protein n=1 Tax=Nocardioides convexus TaxID=2712224 RepID=UPI0024181CC3|nr:hypothetical protein [Nocardioides convexus]NHA01398.1 hypothetical protein [Nocardioides convexus]
MTLEWGRHYAMVDPAAYRIDYAINPYMDPAVQPDPVRARDQWQTLAGTLRALGAEVEEIPALPQAPDMVYAMNLGLVALRPDWSGPGRRSVVMSHMRFPQRRVETPAARAWFESHGFAASYVGRDGIGAHFEAGDAFPFRGEPGGRARSAHRRVSPSSRLAHDLGVVVRGVRITHPGMYHLDLAFCPLDEDHALVCPAAFDEASAAMLLDLVPQPVVLSEEEAIGRLVRELRGRRAHRGDARVPAPGPQLAGHPRLRRGAGGRLGVPPRGRLDPLPHQPARHHPGPRPRGGDGRRRAVERGGCRLIPLRWGQS